MEIGIAVFTGLNVGHAHDIQHAFDPWGTSNSPKAWAHNFECTTLQFSENRCFGVIFTCSEFQKVNKAFVHRAPRFLDGTRRYWSTAIRRTLLHNLRKERKLLRKRYIASKMLLSTCKAATFRNGFREFWRAPHTFLHGTRMPLNVSVPHFDTINPDKELKLPAKRYISRSKFRRHPPSWSLSVSFSH